MQKKRRRRKKGNKEEAKEEKKERKAGGQKVTGRKTNHYLDKNVKLYEFPELVRGAGDAQYIFPQLSVSLSQRLAIILILST